MHTPSDDFTGEPCSLHGRGNIRAATAALAGSQRCKSAQLWRPRYRARPHIAAS